MIKNPHRLSELVDGKVIPLRHRVCTGQKPLEFCFVKARFIFRVCAPQKIIKKKIVAT